MLAGMVKGIIGMGLPTVAMSVLGLPMATPEAVALLALLPAMAGMMLGQRIRQRMQPDAFRRFLLIWMLVVDSYMLRKAVL